MLFAVVNCCSRCRFLLLRQPGQHWTTFFPSHARNLLLSLVVLCCFCCRFLLFYDNQDNIGQLFCEFCEDSSLCLCQEIADSSLRNAPRSVSRTLTSFRDDCRGGLSLFCCPLLFIVVYVVVFFFFFTTTMTTLDNL